MSRWLVSPQQHPAVLLDLQLDHRRDDEGIVKLCPSCFGEEADPVAHEIMTIDDESCDECGFHIHDSCPPNLMRDGVTMCPLCGYTPRCVPPLVDPSGGPLTTDLRKAKR